MKKYWKTLVLSGVFIGLLIFIVSTTNNENDKNNQNILFETDASNITSVEVFSDYSYEIKRDNDGFSLYVPEKIPAQSGVLEGIVNSSSKIEYEEIIDENPSNYEQFGIYELTSSIKPTRAIKITTNTGVEKYLYFGDNTPTSDGVYVKAEDQNKVFKISNIIVENLFKNINSIIEKRLASIDNNELNKVVLSYEGIQNEFNKRDDEWFFGNNRIKKELSNQIIDKVITLSVDELVKKENYITNTENPDIVLRGYDNDNEFLKILLFENDDVYYVIREGISAQYYISKYDIEGVSSEISRLYVENLQS